MENQMSLKDNLGYVSLLFLGWLLLCLCMVTYLFPSNIPNGYKYIAVFSFAGITTHLSLIISSIIINILKGLVNFYLYRTNNSKDFDSKLKKSSTILDWIKEDSQSTIIASEFWSTFFNLDGTIKQNIPEYYTPINKDHKIRATQYTLVATLVSYLKTERLLTEEYTWKQLIQITGKLFKIGSSIKNKEYQDENLKSLIL